MDRRRFIVSVAAGGAALAAGGFTASARAADTPTDDELAFANFGLAAEFLLEDFYARVAAAKLASGAYARDISRGALNASEHAAALAKLLAGAGQSAAGKEDFEFAWPDGTFVNERASAAAGLTVTRALLGAYIGATAVISIPSYRQLYSSMGANVAQQVAALSQWGGARTIGVSFPPAIDLETANAAIEAYLG